jgi:putative xylitol transport system permease protein
MSTLGGDKILVKEKSQNKKKILTILSDYGIFFVFLFLVIVLAIAKPNFLRPQNIMNVLRQTSINGLLSIGMTFVILTGGIDLSVGSMLAFGGVVAASFASDAMGGSIQPPLMAAGIGLVAGLVLGAFNGVLIAKWRVPAFVVTLGMLSIARGLTFIYTDGMPIPRIDPSFLVFGQGVIFGIPLPVIIFAIVYLIAWIILYKTRYGRYVYAVGGNEKSAKVSGVNTRLIVFSVYAISGLLSALGGIILTARTTAGLPQAGQAYELDAIAAVVIGGTSLSGGQGALSGTIIGALLIGVINNGLDLIGVSSYYQQVIKGAIIIGAVLLDSFRKKD